LAAHWGHYTIDEFEALPVERQEFIIAAYITNNQIEAVMYDEQDKARKRGGRK